MPINNFLLPGAKASVTYDIDNSCRFNKADSARLSKTQSSPTLATKFTLSFWVKRCNLTYSECFLFDARVDANNRFKLSFQSADKLECFNSHAGSDTIAFVTNRQFRDPSAWMHIVLAVDTTDGTAGDRFKVYVNGTRETSFSSSTNPSQNDANNVINENSSDINIGAYNSGSGFSNFFDGYMTEVVFIDGTAYAASDFGEFNEDSPTIWQPKDVSGLTFGTNGFYLDFEDSSNLGNDANGGTDFSETNIVATDQATDTPTNNWCVYNPLAKMPDTGAAAVSEGNLKIISSSWGGFKSSFKVPKTGKFYCEVYVGGTTDGSNTNVSGLVPGIQDHYTDTGAYAWFSDNGVVRYSNSDLTTTTGPDTGDIMSWYVNDGEVKIYLNNSLVHTYSTNLSAVDDDYYFYTQCTGSSHFATVNFGQDSSFAGVLTAQNNDDDGDTTADWYYSPPSGVSALCSKNLTDNTIDDPTLYFNTVIYTGTGTTHNVTGVGFDPDFLWGKSRSGTDSHELYDKVRGATKRLVSDTYAGENTESYQSFITDGFAWSAGGNCNTSTATNVAWCWKANGSGSANTEGNTDTTISANTTSGFSIIDGCDSLNDDDTFGHGLDSAPNMVFLKRVDDIGSWRVFYTGITSGSTLILNTDAAVASDSACIKSVSSTLITSEGSGTGASEGSGQNVAYAWHSVQGFSKIGTYIGNGSTDGTYIHLGFRPAFVMLKRTDSTGNWGIHDNKRDVDNVIFKGLIANDTDADDDHDFMDFTANGLKLRSSSSNRNGDGATYVYISFAEAPFFNSNGVPCNAR